MTESRTRFRHPIYPSFWAHPRQGCFEVAPKEDHLTFLKTQPGYQDAEAAYGDGWLSAVRWTGPEDFWLLRCERITISDDLAEVFARYLVERFPFEGGTCVVVKQREGEPVRGTLVSLAEGGLSTGRMRRPKLPGNPGAVPLSVRNNFATHCGSPQDRRHHPVYPGYWLHPDKGTFPLGPEEHHSRYFLAHRELFGDDLGEAFADGWVTTRRWTGYQEAWALRYDNLDKVEALLRDWATATITRYPDEALAPLLCFPASETDCLRGTLRDLAAGKAERCADPSATLPPPERLHAHCVALWAPESGGRKRDAFQPWPDFVEPEESGFSPLSPLRGDANSYMIALLEAELANCEQRLADRGFRGVMARWSSRITRRNLKSWIRQLTTGNVPACVGDGYREWLDYLRRTQKDKP